MIRGSNVYRLKGTLTLIAREEANITVAINRRENYGIPYPHIHQTNGGQTHEDGHVFNLSIVARAMVGKSTI